MSLKHCTDPEIVAHLQSLTRTKPVNNVDLNEIRKITESRSLTRRDKQAASLLLSKYQYKSKSPLVNTT